jgi:hypothetical protein
MILERPLNNVEVVVGIGCLFLGTMFLLFRPQILILIGRLANTEFSIRKNQWTNAEAVTLSDTLPWNWYKAWRNALLHPNEDTWIALSSEKGVSFKKAYLWITITSLLFPLVYSIVTWIKFPQAINASSLVSFIRNILLVGVLEPVGFIAITGTIHLLAKLFLGKGNYRNFFVVFATSYAPISLLYTFAALMRWSFVSKFWLYAGLLLAYYFIIFVCTEIVRFNYHINRFTALLINVVVAGSAFFLAYRIYCATGFGI